MQREIICAAKLALKTIGGSVSILRAHWATPLLVVAAMVALTVNRGNTEPGYARINFDGPSDGVHSDGSFACAGFDCWDYGDWRDPDDTKGDGTGGCQAGVSGGGRLHFGTTGLPDSNPPILCQRWLVLDFSAVEIEYPSTLPLGYSSPDIDRCMDPTKSSTNPPVAEDTLSPPLRLDNVKPFIRLPNIFKPGATQDTLFMQISDGDLVNCHNQPGKPLERVSYGLQWLKPLNITEVSQNPLVRTFKTGTAPGDDVAELSYVVSNDTRPGKAPKPTVIGRYHMPINWTLTLKTP